VSTVFDAALKWASGLARGSEMLIVGATRAAADEFARLLYSEGALGVRRMTLTQLAVAIAARRMAEQQLAPATRFAVQAIAARIAFTLNKRGQFPYFGPVV
jgi:hypothetical protein